MRPLLADPDLKPSPADLRAARDRAAELLRIRFSSPLFRLGSARLVQERVSFPTGGPGQTPGVIVMAIDGRSKGSVVVVFNATPSATTQTVASLAGRRYRLHPVQASGGDPIVRAASAASAARSPCRAARWRCSSAIGDGAADGPPDPRRRAAAGAARRRRSVAVRRAHGP